VLLAPGALALVLLLLAPCARGPRECLGLDIGRWPWPCGTGTVARGAAQTQTPQTTEHRAQSTGHQGKQ
jgi:hypothetical protein